MKKRKSQLPGDILLVLIMILVLFPLVWLYVSSFKSDIDVIKWPPHFFPSRFVTVQYAYVMKAIPVLRMLANTVLFAGLVTVISLGVDSLAAYAFSRMHFRGRKMLFSIILLTMMVPFQVIMIPLYMEEYRMGILNTIVGLVLPRASSAYGIFMLTSFFRNIPSSLDEAARIDGCGALKIFINVILPISKPGIAAVGVYAFMCAWNEYLYSLILLTTEEKYTISLGLSRFITEFGTYWNQMGAASIIVTIPTLLIFMLLGKNLIEGLTAGAVKG